MARAMPREQGQFVFGEGYSLSRPVQPQLGEDSADVTDNVSGVFWVSEKSAWHDPRAVLEIPEMRFPKPL